MAILKSRDYSYGVVILFFILLGLYVRDEMIRITMLDMATGDYGYSRYYVLGMLIIGLFYLLQVNSQRRAIKLPRVGYVFNAFLITTYILSIFPFYSTHFGLLSDYFARLLPLIGVYISYYLFQTVSDNEKVLIWMYVYAAFLGYFYVITSLNKLSSVLTENTVSSSVYSLLFLIPLLLCSKRRLLKVTAIVVIGVLVILSAKRGAFVAFLLGLVVFILVKFVLANKLKFKHIFFAGLLLFGIAIGLSYLQNDQSILLFSRMEGIGNHGYSYGDRGEIYPKVLRMILSSDLFGMILGHGYNSVIKDLGMGYSAHNDFLEIWYDFGLLGFIPYLILWYHIIKIGFKMAKKKSVYAAPYFYLLSIFLVNSMVSHIFLFNQYLLMFSVAFGSLWSLYYRERLLSTCEK